MQLQPGNEIPPQTFTLRTDWGKTQAELPNAILLVFQRKGFTEPNTARTPFECPQDLFRCFGLEELLSCGSCVTRALCGKRVPVTVHIIYCLSTKWDGPMATCAARSVSKVLLVWILGNLELSNFFGLPLYCVIFMFSFKKRSVCMRHCITRCIVTDVHSWAPSEAFPNVLSFLLLFMYVSRCFLREF